MRRFGRMLLALALLAGAAAPATGQLLPPRPLSVEGRAGAALPQGDFAQRRGGFEAEPGYALALGGALQLTSIIGVYAQAQLTEYGCAGCTEVGLDSRARETGVEAGAQLVIPFELARMRPWLRGGVVRHTLELTGQGSGTASEPALGYGVGGGVQIPLGLLLVSPGVHYRSYSAEFTFQNLPTRSTDVSRLTIDLGLSFRL